MSERAVPFHCPYCGEEDLRPADPELGGSAWSCGDCRRVFALKFVGLSGAGQAGVGATTGGEQA